MKFSRPLLRWIVATVMTAVTGSVLQTQFNLAAIAAVGAPVTPGVRLQTTLQDLAGFAPLLWLICATGFALAFPVAARLARRRPRYRHRLFALAGATALGLGILLVNAIMHISIIAAARTAPGFIALVAAGGFGGWVYAGLAPREGAGRVA